MINVMQTEERSASVTHSVQNLRWLPHHCTTDNSGQRGNAACGYTNCILAMLTLHNAKISSLEETWFVGIDVMLAASHDNKSTTTHRPTTTTHMAPPPPRGMCASTNTRTQSRTLH